MTVLVTGIYLVRAGEDPGLLSTFFKSIGPLADRIEWLIYAKGEVFVDLNALPVEIRPQTRIVNGPDTGFDLGSYRDALQHVRTPWVMFFNSYSRMLSPDWLSPFVQHMTPDVGLIGATGSHEGVPGCSFPNPHVRTNAFAMPKELAESLSWSVVTKEDANALEAGPQSLTRQVLAKGRKAIVVSKDTWGLPAVANVENLLSLRDLCTFRWGSQKGLLVADNRTDAYARSSSTGKDYLETLAWGKTQTPDDVLPTILIPSYRSAKTKDTWVDLNVCLASIEAYAPECPRFIGYDGEPEETLFMYRSFTRRPPGLSGPAAYTWCAKNVNARHLVLMNDDAVFHPDTVKRLIEDWQTLKSKSTPIGFLGTRSNFVAGAANVRHANGGVLGGLAYSSEDQILAVDTVFPVCAMIDRDVYLDAGGFQPEINWYADNLLCFDLKKKGYQHFVSRAYVHHVGMRGTFAEAGRSMAEENARGLAWLAKNRPDYLAAHGGSG